jgi:glycosyltransferase involved in cell wall biosynthesis
VSSVVSALHVGDAAFTAVALVAEARRRDLPWDHLPLAAAPRGGNLSRQVRWAATGAGWLAQLAVGARRHDVVHVHSATTLHHVRPVTRRFVLHCHGSDVRSVQYQPGRSEEIRAGLCDAEAVFYSTPDLVEHVLPHRPDATLVPVPVDVTALPPWRPVDGPPQVVFASRWEGVKGLQTQLETARLLQGALAGRAELVGLDWGPATAEATAAGVRLVPRLDHTAYLRLLAGATAVIGQAAGILSASELEALGSGAPLAVPNPLALYAASAPPVLGADPATVAEAVLATVVDPGSHDPQVGRAWVDRWHSPEHGVDTVVAAYDSVMGGR